VCLAFLCKVCGPDLKQSICHFQQQNILKKERKEGGS
jgi:hypothetical protein